MHVENTLAVGLSYDAEISEVDGFHVASREITSSPCHFHHVGR